MSCFCLDMDEGLPPDLMVHRTEEIVLSEPKKCCECGEEIPAGTKVEATWFVERRVWEKIEWEEWEGPVPEDPEWLVTCPACQEIVDNFICGTRFYGELYEALNEEFRPDVDPCCLDGLSPEAAAKLDEHVFFDDED